MPRSPDQNQSQFDSDNDPRHVPKADQGAYNFTPSQAATTIYSSSMAAPTLDARSEAESRLSTYTYSSAIDAQKFLKKIGDRSWNVLTETYFLPADDDEWARLDKQHVAFKIGIGGLCPDMSTVRAILAPEVGIRKRIADLGCGTGVWAHEMAAEFPDCRVLGIDLAPVPINEETLSENCAFEIDDINLGLDHFREEPFDVCHARLIASGLKDYRKTMQEVHACLRPGGLALWIDVDYHLMTSDEHVYLQCASDENPSGSWTARMFYELRRAAVKTGKSDIYGMADALDEGLWNDPLMDPETCKAASLYLPIGPWLDGNNTHETQQLKYIGAIMRQDLMVTQRALHTVLKKAGWSQETLNEWSKNADEELMSNKLPILLRMRLAWGRRRQGPGEPAPPLEPATHHNAEDSDDPPPSPYPYLYIYHTQEQSLKEAELRKRSDINPPPGPIDQAAQSTSQPVSSE